jgi:hypothetical protein
MGAERPRRDQIAADRVENASVRPCRGLSIGKGCSAHFTVADRQIHGDFVVNISGENSGGLFDVRFKTRRWIVGLNKLKLDGNPAIGDGDDFIGPTLANPPAVNRPAL